MFAKPVDVFPTSTVAGLAGRALRPRTDPLIATITGPKRLARQSGPGKGRPRESELGDSASWRFQLVGREADPKPATALTLLASRAPWRLTFRSVCDLLTQDTSLELSTFGGFAAGRSAERAERIQRWRRPFAARSAERPLGEKLTTSLVMAPSRHGQASLRAMWDDGGAEVGVGLVQQGVCKQGDRCP